MKDYSDRYEYFKALTSNINFKKPFPTTEFLTAPASTVWHGAYESGLFDHSLATFESLIELTSRMSLKWERPESPLIVGMFHDICKIDSYKPILSNIVINDVVSIDHYEHTTDCLMDGHGAKSVIYLQKYIDLTDEEIACIRWHMGAFDDKANWGYYSRAIEKYPNVLYTHTADMIASKIKGV